MKVFHDIPDNKNLFKNPVVTIGNFDGVHLGHRKILKSLMETARGFSGEPVVITFAEHPRKVLYPEVPCRVITTRDEKTKAIYEAGISNMILLDFTRKMSEMSAVDFYNEYLIKKLDIKGIVIGYDHAFGRGREGNVDFLKELSQGAGITVVRVDEEFFNSRPVSSTWLRSELGAGNFPVASSLLGRRYSLTGHVIRGVSRGRELGFPTANVMPDNADKIVPADGVYAVEVIIGRAGPMKGMLNIGNNPTFSGAERSIEVNIFDFSGDLYESEITIVFHRRIRDEVRFSSVEGLIKQLKKDRAMSLEILKQ